MSKTPKDDMFTQKEAVEFLQNSWKIKDVLKRMKTDRKNLADEIVVQILANVPFQSITLVAAKPEERNCPSYEEIKQRCTSGKKLLLANLKCSKCCQEGYCNKR